VDIAIVLGDEWGDGTYTNFNMGDGYNFGQGLYYLSTGTGAFVPVAGSQLSQFDGTGTEATGTPDLDGNRLTDRWEAKIPWTSLNAAEGIDSISNCVLGGLIVNSTTSGVDRYISGNYLGLTATGMLNETSHNYEFEMVYLEPRTVGLFLADSDLDGIPDAWENQFFSSLGVLGMYGDRDSDGATDRDEYLAGTNPVDNDSCFRCYTPYVDAGSEFVLSWSSVSNREYDIRVSTNISWGFDMLQSNVVATPPQNVYTDNVSAAGVRFYQIRTQHE
jgi:hypothetical protein